MSNSKKDQKKVKLGNEVLVKARIFGISAAGNPCVQFPCGVKALIKPEDIAEVTKEAEDE
jgi:hypothetical protein